MINSRARRPACLHEAHVPRRDLGLEREAELALAAQAAPVREQVTEGIVLVSQRCARHAPFIAGPRRLSLTSNVSAARRRGQICDAAAGFAQSKARRRNS